ncbi:MAG: hypothetical protein DKM24_08560 [Candidatus Melainabacteria bacterium]|nr:MAG: hypothetical protein DKM24_08560 [Candidatus Melainabacteria bacterium]
MDYIKEFTSALVALDRSKNISTVFLDFLTLSMCSLAQPFYRSQNLEQRYKNTICNYTKEQAEEFLKLLALLISALEEKHQDFLGQIFSNLNLGNSNKGQFFTPYHVSKLMAQINFTDIENQLTEKDFVTLAEPCCGSGGIIIAFAETLKEQCYNYQHQLFVEVIDIDETCFKMAYIQLSILGIPARVMLDDTLAWKFQKVLYTPFYFLNSFEYKLKYQQQELEKPAIVEMKQLSLFSMF